MEEILGIRQFWFGDDPDDERTDKRQAGLWWSKDAGVDRQIRQQFENTLLAVERGDLSHWDESPEGLSALILLTDQFSRNMYRGTARAFAFDALALAFCRLAIEREFDLAMRPIERVFMHMPLVHSESLADQQQAVQLARALTTPGQQNCFTGFLDFAIQHHDIIARFGRYPHRNLILGRPSSAEELAFLQQPGSSF
ncbi:DUF924 family protein [Paraherbaspirillum soli]|uniref:DUF924 family protein n=1 Tax=Paraherbaspirillum soli TaxID=631222 RepID=A0ABW0M5S7_9BURK